MPETSGQAIPGGAGRVRSWRAARNAGRSAAKTTDNGSRAPSAVQILADRLAVVLTHHEPGWRLPRHSVLARRYDVSTAQVEAAISELAGRHLIRRLPDGQVHRASPAEYLIPLEGVPGLRSRLDPMASDLTCRSHRTSWRRAPDDISVALQVDPAEQVCVVQAVWAAGDELAASAITYMPAAVADAMLDAPRRRAEEAEAHWNDLASVGEPAALHVEMQQPPPSIARSLRLPAGHSAAMVTTRFDDPATGRPAALTLAVLRPELFRIVVETSAAPLPAAEQGSLPAAWTVADWESLAEVPAS
jgi:DNA-binding GntR family transcriptional regulator